MAKVEYKRVSTHDDDKTCFVNEDRGESRLRLLNLFKQQRPPTEAGIICNGLGYSVPLKKSHCARNSDTRKPVFQNVSFHIPHAQVLAVMGRVGSGKSTLLSCLAHRLETREGICLTYATNPIASPCATPRVFVPQHPVFHECLTVVETLTFTVQLLWPNWTPDAQRDFVQLLLANLDLDTQQHQSVGHDVSRDKPVLSGGQRRLLAIAMALASMPSILILDEPTSGLDAGTALRVMQLLHDVSRSGCAVVLTLHQPSPAVFELVDELVVLRPPASTQTTNVVYVGPRERATHAFEQVFKRTAKSAAPAAPADFILDCIDENGTLLSAKCPSGIQEAINKWTNYGLQPASSSPSRILSATKILVRRDLQNQWRHPNVVWVRLLINIALCLFVGTLFSHVGPLHANRVSYHYLVATSMVTFTIVTCLEPLIQERSIYLQETANAHYSALSYALALSVSSLPFLALLVAVCTLLQAMLIPDLFPTFSHLFFYMIAYCAVLYCTESMLQLVSISLGGSLAFAGLVGGCFLALGSFLSGTLILPSQMPLLYRLLHSLTFQSYHLASVVVNDLGPRTVQYENTTVAMGQTMLQALELSDFHRWSSIAIVLGFALAFRVATLFFLILASGRRRCS